MMHPEDQSFRESGEFATQMHNSWAKHNLTFKFHALAGPFPSCPRSLRRPPALHRALIIGYLVITGDTFFLVADIARNSPRSYINLSSYRLRAPGSRPKIVPGDANEARRNAFSNSSLFSSLENQYENDRCLQLAVRSCDFTNALNKSSRIYVLHLEIFISSKIGNCLNLQMSVIVLSIKFYNTISSYPMNSRKYDRKTILKQRQKYNT